MTQIARTPINPAGMVQAVRDDLASTASAALGPSIVGYAIGQAYSDGALHVGAALHAQGRVLQGADRTGVADSTLQLRALFDLCIPAGHCAILPGGTYRVTDRISSVALIAAGSLHIRCIGDVTIEVDAASAAFPVLLSCHTTAINSSSIGGGRLTLKLANKCATGIYLRHAGGDGGYVDWGPITVTQAKNNDAGSVTENQGLLIFGRYVSGVLRQPIVDGVDRLNVGGGACKGISISEIAGAFTLLQPQVARVLCTGSSADADGIAVFGRQLNGGYGYRAGKVLIVGPVVTDCQGRSIKSQVSDTTIVHPTIYRQNVVAFSTADIDVQVGGTALVLEPTFDYRKAAGVAPFAAGFYPVSLQQQCTDQPNRLRVVGGTLRTDAQLPRFCYLTVGAASLAGDVEISDVEFQATGGLASPIFARAVLEFHAGQVQAAAATNIVLRANRGSLSGCRLLGYTDASTTNATKLSFELDDNVNTGPDHVDSKCFDELSGTIIEQVSAFRMRGNVGFLDYLGIWHFDCLTLGVGCSFSYARAGSTVSNGPAGLAATQPRVECFGMLGVGYRDVRVTEDTGVSLVQHYRQAGAWRKLP